MRTRALNVIVPEEANWIATDGNGRVHAYRFKPRPSPAFAVWTSASRDGLRRANEYWFLAQTPPTPGWRRTLVKIERRSPRARLLAQRPPHSRQSKGK